MMWWDINMIKLKKLLKEEENLGKSLSWIQANMKRMYEKHI